MKISATTLDKLFVSIVKVSKGDETKTEEEILAEIQSQLPEGLPFDHENCDNKIIGEFRDGEEGYIISVVDLTNSGKILD